jgi:peptidylprolyl isomerase
MQKPKSGDTVRVHYTGTLDDGTQFDSSRGKDPLEFAIGQGQLIAGFEKAVADLAVGESCTITLPPEEGYGEVNPAMVHEVPRNLMPEGVELKAGLVLQGKAEDGRVDSFTVVSFTDEVVTLDANHPLAGKSLTFEIELLEIGATRLSCVDTGSSALFDPGGWGSRGRRSGVGEVARSSIVGSASNLRTQQMAYSGSFQVLGGIADGHRRIDPWARC